MKAPSRRQWYVLLGFCVFALAVFLSFRLTVVRGDSMVPTYRDGQMVLAFRLYRLLGGLKKGDVVIVRVDSDILIKRVAYLPGETLSPRASLRFLSVRDYFDRPENPQTPYQVKVPQGTIVVLGDNRRVSEDSRNFGPVRLADVLGKVVNAPPAPSAPGPPQTRPL